MIWVNDCTLQNQSNLQLILWNLQSSLTFLSDKSLVLQRILLMATWALPSTLAWQSRKWWGLAAQWPVPQLSLFSITKNEIRLWVNYLPRCPKVALEFPLSGFPSHSYLISCPKNPTPIHRKMTSNLVRWTLDPFSSRNEFHDDWLSLIKSLETFSIERDTEYFIPILKQALELNPSLKFIATPWSAPGWMKVSIILNFDWLNLPRKRKKKLMK